MKKSFISKSIYALIIITILALSLSSYSVNASTTNLEEFDLEEINLKDVITQEEYEALKEFQEMQAMLPKAEEKIIKYDATTGESTEVDLEALKSKVRLLDATSNISTNYIPSYNPNSERYLDRNGTANPYSLFKPEYTKIDNPTVFPYNVICKISMNGGTASGTGFMVAPKLMLTAAHNLYDVENENELRDFVVFPAYNDGMYNNLKSEWQTIYRSSVWLETHDRNYDWALVELKEDFGLGYMGSIRYATDEEMEKLPVRAIGYPKDPGGAYYQYSSTGKITDVYPYYYMASCPNEEGMSGGPITLNTDGYYDYATGLVSGRLDGTFIVETYGVRYTEYMTDVILSYIN